MKEARGKMEEGRFKIQFILCFFLLSSFFSLPSSAHAGLSDTIDILDRIPIQHNGRVKPFQSFAQETSLHITGRKSYEGIPATQLVWNWITHPEFWNAKPLIPVVFRPLRKEFSVMLVDNKISPEMVSSYQPFLDQVEQAGAKQRKKQNLTVLEKEVLALYSKARRFNDIGSGVEPGWMPHPENSRQAWFTFQAFAKPEEQIALAKSFPDQKTDQVRNALQNLIEAYRANPSSDETTQKAKQFSQALSELRESGKIALDQKVLDLEIIYDRLHPFGWAWKFYAAALLLFILLGLSLRASNKIALPFFITGFLIHSYGFYLRCVVAGRPPVTNMYESLVWVSWAICFFSLILFAVYKSSVLPAAAGAVATLALIVAETFPAVLDPSVSPLVPVLRSNYWLTIHVLTITLSYGAFALAWGIGHVVVVAHAMNPEKDERNQMLAQYLYRAVQIGVILLATGTVLGGVWANYSWGRFWGWDPKETWALIALLGYLTVLHGRFVGWLDVFGLAAASVIAFAGVVMAWYGVNFVLAAGLHSYGFGGGGAPYVLGAVLLDFVLIGALIWRYRHRVKEITGKGIGQV
ncbi:MAG: cytochrome C biogenesis protein [Candidatus Omnitrophica bacterium]|nr:cytochrome C biogenesis protein [Candidatus Omnitrophota bacterium]